MEDFALPGCRLEAGGMRSQRDRYARLGASAVRLWREPRSLTVEFAAGVDEALVEETLAVERACCPFFALGYDREARRLTAAVPDESLDAALDALIAALALPASAAA